MVCSLILIKDTTNTVKSASYLDIHLAIDSEDRLRTKHYDKRDYFNFLIMTFPFIYSNIPAAPAYGLYLSQLVRYNRGKLLNQGFLLVKLKSSQMTTEMFHLSLAVPGPFLIHELSSGL